MGTTVAPDDAPLPGAYVPETRFGAWFQSTDIWRRYVVEEAVAELLSLLPARPAAPRVLDAGCGDGVAFPLLAAAFGPATLLGLDIDPEAVRRARLKGQAHGGAIAVHRGDASRLPLEDGTLDIIFCHQLLHHANEPAAVLAEFHRALAPGGWLLVAESCREFLDWWPVRLLFRHPARAQPTASGYRDLVRAAGFTLQGGGYLTPAPWWSRRDLGIGERVGRPAALREPRQVRIVARRRSASAQIHPSG